jgi:hypothetical protein
MSDGRLHLSFDAFHDGDADVWVARSAEGRITTEAPSRDALVERAASVDACQAMCIIDTELHSS